MRSITGGACPGCGGTQFIGKRTSTGLLFGGFVFAPQRLLCITCGETLKAGSPATSRARSPAPAPKPATGETRTKHGYVRRANGNVVVPRETGRLYNAWRTVRADIAGLTLAEIVQRVGFEPDATAAETHMPDYLKTWSRPGYTISVLFDSATDRALRIPKSFEELG